MGRGHESQVRICDISVSRCHTLIKYQKQTRDQPAAFQLEDNLSKFGTLVLPRRKQIDVRENETKALQLGRSVVSFTVKMVEKEVPQPAPQVTISMDKIERLAGKKTRESSHDAADLTAVDIDRIRAKIDETDEKIARLLQCEQNYLNQLKEEQRCGQHDKKEGNPNQQRETVEDALIQAAQTLMRAKARLQNATAIDAGSQVALQQQLSQNN